MAENSLGKARSSETPSPNRWQLSRRPPQALRAARLDNIAIVPASLLPQRARYQAIANGLPAGDVLIVVSPSASPERQLLAKTAALFEAKGRHVTTLSADALHTP